MSHSSKARFELPPEQEAIRAKCFHPTGHFIEFAKEEIEQSIAERFEKIVRQFPGRVAVKTRNHKLAYAELNHAANQVAKAVLAEGGKGQEPVVLLFDNGAPIIAAIVGVLKARKIYVPLDPSYPRARIVNILENSKARLIVTNSKNLSLAKDLSLINCPVVNIDKIDFSASAENPKLSISPDSPANIIFTSGSTGQPKGVIQTHRNVLHEIMNYTNAVHICAADRFALLSSPSFADAVRTIYGALLNGACLYPLDLKHEGLVQLADWLIKQEITIYRSVPSVFRQFVDTLTGKKHFPHLRLIYSAGDSVTWADVESYKRHFLSNCVFLNGLGSTESLTYQWYFISKETLVTGSSVPVGYALQGKLVALLDDHGNEIGLNEIGQIAVTSRYLSPGYWNRPDLTQAAFRCGERETDERIYFTGDMGRMGPDGCLTHIGRKDFQVKIRGQRIEVAEIEMALLSLKTIKEAVVVARENRVGERRLVAYLVPKKHPGPSVSSVRRVLEAKLPDYMIPSSYVWVDALPLSPHKKVDRGALPDPGNSRPALHSAYVAPRDLTEEQLSRIWAEVLSLDQIGIHDNFFDLGGHSLAATRVVSRVIRTFQLEIPVKCLFESPTVAEMALLIAEHQQKKLSEKEMKKILCELESLTEAQAQRLLSNENETGHGKDGEEAQRRMNKSNSTISKK